ncbi:MAG TPA: hypothetical protein VJM50_11825 [Pyrinomonadaceae bacterium]|nr:hypothetical protein [Pyrinomonadaceae bacterium]
MSSTNVIVPPEVGHLIAEREQIWANFDRAQSLAAEFQKLCSQVPNVAPATLQLPASPNPPAHLETTMQQIRQELTAVEKLNTEMRSCHEQIEAIKRNEKMTIALIAGGVLVALIIFIIVVAALVSSISQ